MKKNKISPDNLLKLGTAFMASKTLLSAIELGLFTELAKGPRDKDALRVYMNLHPSSVGDFLDALVALGMLDRKGSKYRNTPETELFLDRSKPTYLGGLLEMCNTRLYGFCGSRTEGLKPGSPQNEAKQGGNFFEILYNDPERLKGFLQAMTGLSLGAGRAIAGKFPWKQHKTFYDLGGAQGAVAVQVALKHKHLKGGNLDLPMVGPIFEEYVRSFKLEGRLKFVAGDFFKDALPPADGFTLGHTLPHWT